MKVVAAHLKTQQVVNSADDDVDCGRVSSLGSQEVLEICFTVLYWFTFILKQCNYGKCLIKDKSDFTSVMSLTQELQKPEQVFSKLVVL